jgi:DNA polymerase III subunit epsilon
MQTHRPWHAGELLAFDLETTGVDPFTDVPVSFALVRMVDGVVASRETSLVDPGRPIPQPAMAVHGITDECARSEGMALPNAVSVVAEALLDASGRGVPVVGMKLDFDLTIVDVCHRREHGFGLADAGFSGPAIDALVLDRHFDRFRRGRRSLASLCAQYGAEIEHAHDAVADAKATLDVVLAMCARFPELSAATPGDLHRQQTGWHREWADSFSQWRMREGMLPLEPCSRTWPIAWKLEDVAIERAAV